MFTSSLARKLAFTIALPLGLVGLGALAWVRDAAERAVAENAEQEMVALAEQVATTFELAEPGAEPHRAVDAAMRAEWRPMGHVRELRIVGRDGKVRWSRRVEEVGQLLPDAPRVLKLEAHEGVDVIRPLGGMGCATCHTKDAFFVGALQLAIDEPKLARDVRDLHRGALTFLFVTTALLALVLFLAARVVVIRPLQRLRHLMLRAQAGEILVRATVDRRDEIGELQQAFNTMLAKITDLSATTVEQGMEVDRMHRELKLTTELERQSQTIADQNRSLQARVRELTLLSEVTRSMNATLELGEILELVTELVGVTLGFSEFAVLLVDVEKNDLVVSATWGFPDDAGIHGMRFGMHEGVSGEAARSGRAVLVPDVEKEERFLWYRGKLQHAGAFLSVPMVHKGTVVGLLNFSRPERDSFHEDDVNLLTSVAGQAALAIANARLYQQTVELTLTDPLTGVHNRRHLFARLEMEITRAQRFGTEVSFVMIDVDHFKHYNDTNGHSAGDEVLRLVATSLGQVVRKIDTVARFGGEEFAVILPQVRAGEAAEVAEKLRRTIARTDVPHGASQPGGLLTISVGFATWPHDARELAALVDAADSALYASKRGGRNRVTGYKPGLESLEGRERAAGDAKRRLVDPQSEDKPS